MGNQQWPDGGAVEGASGDVGKVRGNGGVLVVAKVGQFRGRRCRATLRRSWKREVDGGELARVCWTSTRLMDMGTCSAVLRSA
jgi:hypothetical protein